MKQKMMEKDGARTEVADNGSVEAMVECGWKVIGDAPDQVAVVLGASEAAPRVFVPRFFYSEEFLNVAVMNFLSQVEGDPDQIVAELSSLYPDCFTPEHASGVHDLVKKPAGPVGERDAPEENEGVDVKYRDMTKGQVRELLDARGLTYPPNANKAKLVEVLVGKK